MKKIKKYKKIEKIGKKWEKIGTATYLGPIYLLFFLSFLSLSRPSDRQWTDSTAEQLFELA